MQSYFTKKLRRQSKQHDQAFTADNQGALDTAVTLPPAPVASTPSEEPAASPVLDEEDEKFLQRLAAIAQEPEGTPPPLPERRTIILEGGEKVSSKDAQQALLDGADTVPLPTSPPEITTEDGSKGKGKAKATMMSYFSLAQSKFKRSGDKDGKAKDMSKKEKEVITDKDRNTLANDIHAAAEKAKSASEEETKAENKELTQILDDLNLSAVNNRVFSFSKESEDLLNKFKLVLKDLVNGVPTAYNDLEKLLTDSDAQMKKMYGGLPPFLQNLVKSLPTKITAALGPELLAAQAEKPGFDAKQRATGFGGGTKSKSKRARIPSLKSLVSAEGAVATMLKSILNFLKLRFPVVMTGTNVLLSLAVFLLLFVFWYCHKRGRETRLDKEGQLSAEGATDSALASSASSFTDGDGDSLLESKTEKGESSKTNNKPEPPFVIHDDKESSDKPVATVADMPSVSHLPDPMPEQKEEPLKVPDAK